MRLFISVFVLIATLCGHSNAAAQNADSVEEICGIGRNNEAKDFSKVRLEECLRLKGHDLFKNGNAFVRPDFSCDSAVPGLRAASHRASNEYCLKVADAHEAIYKFRPYWAFCGEPETVSDKNLQACVRGFFRFNELWQRPSHPRYSTESNCNSALAVYGNAFTDGHIQFDGKQQEKWRVRNAITCDRMRTAIASIVQFESARCYASELFYSDQIAFFQKCMGDAIDADVTCREIQSQYVDRLIKDNGGIPHNRISSQGRIPTCDAILAIRVEPFAAKTRRVEVIVDDTNTAVVDSSDSEVEDPAPEVISSRDKSAQLLDKYEPEFYVWRWVIAAGAFLLVLPFFLKEAIFALLVVKKDPFIGISYFVLVNVIAFGFSLALLFVAHWDKPAFALLSYFDPYSGIPNRSVFNLFVLQSIVYVPIGFLAAYFSNRVRVLSILLPVAIFLFLGADYLRNLHVIFIQENPDVYENVTMGQLITYIYYHTFSTFTFLIDFGIDLEIIPVELETRIVKFMTWSFSFWLFGMWVSPLVERVIVPLLAFFFPRFRKLDEGLQEQRSAIKHSFDSLA